MVRRGALGQVLDLLGDDGEALAVLARLRGDDGGVEREQVRLLRHVVDDVEDVADLADALAQAVDDARGGG